MEATPKLALIQRLGVVPVCARWQAGLPASEDEPELAAKYARWVQCGWVAVWVAARISGWVGGWSVQHE